jgi:phosphatidylserine synthase
MATVGGFLIAMAVSAGLVMLMSKALGLGNQESLQYVSPVVMTVVGFVLGLAQLLVLCRYIRQPHWWVLASTFGWFLLSLIIGMSIDRLIDVVALGAIPAAMTGLALLWLWQGPAESRTSEETHA